MTQRTGYEGVTARIAERLPWLKTDEAEIVAAAIVQAEIRTLVEALRKADGVLHEFVDATDDEGGLECCFCGGEVSSMNYWADHGYLDHTGARVPCEVAEAGKAVSAALDRARTP
jgi:xanthine dehydrogenase iron-sulfur cluster and FAD-binding subunit A